MKARLYAIPASHPSFAAGLRLDRKGIPSPRVRLSQRFYRFILWRLLFPGRTVPALVLDGRRIQTTAAIARALDEVKPEPRLVPDDPHVKEIERWADEE